jgi:hypothetical protein
MNGWEFKSWMPNERQSSAKIIDEQGFKSKNCIQFDADGRDDDGLASLVTIFGNPIRYHSEPGA